MNTFEYLSIAASIVPERIAVSFEGQRPTFRQLQGRVNQACNALASLGVAAGDRVAVMDVNSLAFLELYLACTKLDAIFTPLSYRAKTDELSHMLKVCEPSVLMAGARYSDIVTKALNSTGLPTHAVVLDEKIPGQWLFYQDLVTSSTQDELHSPVDDDEKTTMLLFTAGTTGTPKAVILSHKSFSSYMLSTVPPADPETEEKNLLAVPMYHIAGMQGALAAIYGGRTLVLMRQFDPDQWMKLVENERVDRAGLVPTMLKQLLDHPKFTQHDLSSLKVISYGAAPMPLRVIEKAIKAFPKARFINAFGQTETASTITMLSPEDHIIEGTPQQIKIKLKRLTSVGKPLQDVQVVIVSEDGIEMPIGQTGEVAVKGARLMTGYWNDDESTKRAIRGGWLYTGDLGYRDEDGYIYLTGRSKDFIKRGGEMISPEEVEQVLMTHPYIEDAAVIGVEDIHWGERVRAIVVANPKSSVDERDVITHCNQRAASFKRPESVIFVDELPRNQLGKVLKRVLRERYNDPIDGTAG